jgi:hypothetical protein
VVEVRTATAGDRKVISRILATALEDGGASSMTEQST